MERDPPGSIPDLRGAAPGGAARSPAPGSPDPQGAPDAAWPIEWAQLALSAAGMIAWVWELDTNVVTCSPGSERLFGRRIGAASDFLEAMHPDDRPTVAAWQARVLRGGTPDAHEFRVMLPDGDRWIEGRGQSQNGPDGRPARIVGVCIDITERKRTEAELRRAQEERERLLQSERAARAEAERLSRLKDEFVGTLSHELRTPLNAILGWAQMARQDPGADRMERALTVIERNARVQEKLIADLLDVTRMLAGTLTLGREPVRLPEVIRAAIDALAPSAAAKGIRLTLEMETRGGEGARAVIGDPTRLGQIVANLVSNAIKFTPPGGAVVVRHSQGPDADRLEVEDTGEGIEPAFLPQVFDRFRQADGTAARRHAGLGLGLAITKQLVELHEGSIAAHSDGPGRGARFTVVLPTHAPRGEHAGGEDAGEQAWGGALEGARVLLIEDDADARELLARILRDGGADVATAADAAEALQALDGAPPDLIVSDLGLPGCDGYELLRRVRSASEELARVPAVAVSAFAQPDDRRRALEAGFAAHVPKPVELASLMRAVREALGERG